MSLEIPRRRFFIKSLAFLSVVCYGLATIGVTLKRITSSVADYDIDVTADSYSEHIQTIESSSSRPKNNETSSIPISFTLHNPLDMPYHDVFSWPHCDLGEIAQGGTRTWDVAPSLLMSLESGGRRILDFTTTIDTNLKILEIGDSVTIQIAQALDEMLGGHELDSRQQLWEAWRGADGGTIVAPTRGGGMHGAWRITGLLSQKAYGMKATKNARGGGWNMGQVNSFLDHVYSWGGQNITVESVDVVIFRVMHGWMQIDEITRDRVVEAAELANKLLGANTTIFITVPHTNNVKTNEILEKAWKVNEMIWDVAKNWHLNHSTTMLVMDYATFSNHIIWANARYIGYNVSEPLTASQEVFQTEGPTFLQERLVGHVWGPTVAQVCNKKPTEESGGKYCEQNFLFRDGMHMCAEMLGARVGAGIACLLGCVFNRKESEQVGSLQEKNNTQSSSRETEMLQIRSCERQCNEQFMSVKPLKSSWVAGSSTALASFSGL